MNSDVLFHILQIIFSAYVTLGESVCDIENTVPSLYREAILEVCSHGNTQLYRDKLYNYSDQDCIEGEGVQSLHTHNKLLVLRVADFDAN